MLLQTWVLVLRTSVIAIANVGVAYAGTAHVNKWVLQNLCWQKSV